MYIYIMSKYITSCIIPTNAQIQREIWIVQLSLFKGKMTVMIIKITCIHFVYF